MAGSTETDGSTFFRLGGDEEENADEVNDCQEFVVMCLNASGGNRIGGAFYDAQDAILHLVQVWPQTQFFSCTYMCEFRTYTCIPKGTTSTLGLFFFNIFEKTQAQKKLKEISAENSTKLSLALGSF